MRNDPRPELRSIDQLAKSFMRELAIPGMAVAVATPNGILKTFTYGFEDLATRKRVRPNSIFEVGSLGKQFVSIAVLQLYEEGKLDLSAPVSYYLPWFNGSSVGSPSLHHLLNHTSGLIRGADFSPHGLYESWSLRDRWASRSPGDYFHYSNLGYKVLGFLLERVCEEDLPTIIKSRVLDRLGMQNSFSSITADSRKITGSGYASIYDDRPPHPSHELVSAPWIEYATGDGCQASTVEEMAVYLTTLLNKGQGPRGRLLSESSFRLMTTRSIPTADGYYAYGLAIYEIDGRTLVGHGGYSRGFRSAIMLDVDAGLGVVILSNLVGATEPIVEVAQKMVRGISSTLEGKDNPSINSKGSTAAQNLADYVGRYRRVDDDLSGPSEIRLTVKDGRLFLNEDLELESRGQDRFYLNHPDFALFLMEFERSSGVVWEVFHGQHRYVHDRYSGPLESQHPKEWNAWVGHYRSHSPDLSNFRVVLRKNQLVLIGPWGRLEQLVPLGPGLFRVGVSERSPEWLRFSAVIEGRALRADYSGSPYGRAFTP